MSMMSSARSENIGELKRQALEYYSLNADIPLKVEDALNDLFYEGPTDVFGYLVCLNSFQSLFVNT